MRIPYGSNALNLEDFVVLLKSVQTDVFPDIFVHLFFFVELMTLGINIQHIWNSALLLHVYNKNTNYISGGGVAV
jgi:hypothetical protein